VVAIAPAKKSFEKPTPEMCKLQAAKAGLPESEALRFWNYYESNGWRVGKNPMRSWPSAMANWKLNGHQCGPRMVKPVLSTKEKQIAELEHDLTYVTASGTRERIQHELLELRGGV
jgi:hypothetical protein